MCNKRKIKLNLLNFFLFTIFIGIVIFSSSFFVYFKNDNQDIKTNVEESYRSDNRNLLTELSYDLNKEIALENVNYLSDDDINNWFHSQLIYSVDYNKLENLCVYRFYYDENDKVLESKLLYCLKEEKNPLSDNILKIMGNKSFTDENDNINENNCLIDWTSVPINELKGLNNENKIMQGKINPKYTKIVIVSSIEKQQIENKFESFVQHTTNMLYFSKIAIITFLVMIVFLMIYILWKERKLS